MSNKTSSIFNLSSIMSSVTAQTTNSVCSSSVAILTPVVPISGAYTVNSNQSGTTFSVTQTGAGYTINLPSPVGNNGVNYKFVIASDAVAGVVNLTSTAQNIMGCIINHIDAQANIAGVVNLAAGALQTTISMITQSNRGDACSFISNGTNWIVSGATHVVVWTSA